MLFAMMGQRSPVNARLGATQQQPMRRTLPGRDQLTTSRWQQRTIREPRWTPVRAVAVPNKRKPQVRFEPTTD